jgi:hypothetical protein
MDKERKSNLPLMCGTAAHGCDSAADGIAQHIGRAAHCPLSIQCSIIECKVSQGDSPNLSISLSNAHIVREPVSYSLEGYIMKFAEFAKYIAQRSMVTGISNADALVERVLAEEEHRVEFRNGVYRTGKNGIVDVCPQHWYSIPRGGSTPPYVPCPSIHAFVGALKEAVRALLAQA